VVGSIAAVDCALFVVLSTAATFAEDLVDVGCTGGVEEVPVMLDTLARVPFWRRLEFALGTEALVVADPVSGNLLAPPGAFPDLWPVALPSVLLVALPLALSLALWITSLLAGTIGTLPATEAAAAPS